MLNHAIVSQRCNFLIFPTEKQHADMPPGTDCPYPIRILACFEMIRPYHVVIRIWGKLLKNNLWICVAQQNSFIVDTISFFC